MKFGNCRLTLVILLILYITITQEQNVCNDTYLWSIYGVYNCSDYEFNVTDHWWYPNGTYTLLTMRYGGTPYKYPEFNCCACGKGWPLWYVPASGYTAEIAVPEERVNMTYNLTCDDVYSNASACTMKCKALPDNLTVTTLATMTSEDFNQSTCILDLNMGNSSIQYILQIPSDNYLIYFANWTTNQYNFSCVNIDGLPIEPLQCPSNNITSRYIPPGCVDTANWTSSYNYSCFEYEITRRWCANGEFTSGSIWTGGPYYSYPERNCCACGKGALAPNKSISISTQNNSINASEFGIMSLNNCNTSANPSYLFGIQCLGPLNFINTNTTMDATLLNCPLDCFFNWNTTQIKTTQSINVSRQLYGSSFVYFLTSNLFSMNRVVVCGFLPKEEQTSTDFSSAATTSEQVNTSQSTPIADNRSTSQLSTTTKGPIAWQPPNCANGKIGLNCNISIDTCSMARPCLNNGTCLNTNSSFICLCPPWQFTGTYCENDIRPCQTYTCLGQGICNETNATSFICQCKPGYEGIHCESLINYCLNVTCQNNGQCRPTLLNFTCDCTSKDYSGRYCEIKSSSLITKLIVNRSFAYIALIAIAIVLGFIVILDVLKYFFKIDPVDKERKRLQAKQRMKKDRPIAIRFTYVNKPKIETVTEEP